MGNRISIQFKNGNDKSVVLFSHWGGQEFAQAAKDYVRELKAEQQQQQKGIMYPLDRLDPQTVMVDFIRYITGGQERVESNLYLGATENDGDNSDNGHCVIDLIEKK